VQVDLLAVPVKMLYFNTLFTLTEMQKCESLQQIQNNDLIKGIVKAPEGPTMQLRTLSLWMFFSE